MHLLDSLLTNIKSTIDNSSTLSYIVQTDVIQSLSLQTITSLLEEVPRAFIYPISTQFTPVSFSVACEDHIYQIGIAVFQDNWNENSYALIGGYDNIKGIAEIEAGLRSVLNRERFSIDQLEAYFQGAYYSGINMQERGLAQVTITMRYEYSDIG